MDKSIPGMIDNELLLSPLPPTRNHPTGSLPSLALLHQRLTQSLAARAAATIVSLISQDSVLYEMPNAIWQLDSYNVGDKYSPIDLAMVEKGWLHIQRINQNFGAISRPEETALEDAVEFLQVTV